MYEPGTAVRILDNHTWTCCSSSDGGDLRWTGIDASCLQGRPAGSPDWSDA